MPFCSLGIYMVFLILDVPLLVSIYHAFKENYPEIFNEDKFKIKLVFFFVIKEFFIAVRGFFYYEINYNPAGDYSHAIKLIIYISEVSLALIMMLVAYKNLQSDEESGSMVSDRSPLSTSRINASHIMIRNSFLARKRVNSTAKILKKGGSLHHKEAFDPQALLLPNKVIEEDNQSRWSISNDSSDSNRAGLMGMEPAQIN